MEIEGGEKTMGNHWKGREVGEGLPKTLLCSGRYEKKRANLLGTRVTKERESLISNLGEAVRK